MSEPVNHRSYGEAHKTTVSTDDTVGTAEVGQTGVLIAPAEETSVEAEEEKRTEVAEIAPQEETADLKIAVSPIRPSAADIAEH